MEIRSTYLEIVVQYTYWILLLFVVLDSGCKLEEQGYGNVQNPEDKKGRSISYLHGLLNDAR